MTQTGDRNIARGKLIIISGPSGVGKSTICKQLVARTGAHLSISMTTRPPGPGEQNGREYYFISRDEFRKRIEEGTFLEYAEVFGNLYGTPGDKIEEALDAGKTVILEIDVQGGRQVKALYPQAVTVFILPPNTSALVDRICGRKRESREVIAKRLDGAGGEIASARQCYDNMVVNDDLEKAIEEIVQIIRKAPAVGRRDGSGFGEPYAGRTQERCNCQQSGRTVQTGCADPETDARIDAGIPAPYRQPGGSDHDGNRRPGDSPGQDHGR